VGEPQVRHETEGRRHAHGAMAAVADQVDVGARLRQVRRARHRTLRNVAASAGVSESFLSQVERAKVNASIATLRRIAVALGVTIGALFDEPADDSPTVLRAASRPTLAFGIFGEKFLLHPALHRAFDVFICEFQPGGSTGAEPYAHGDSEEFLVILSGAAELQLGKDVMWLDTDDSIVFRSNVPHRLTADAETGARVLWVATPPSF
jgi:transcriptional regulator with XRE-family HTH domain